MGESAINICMRKVCKRSLADARVFSVIADINITCAKSKYDQLIKIKKKPTTKQKNDDEVEKNSHTLNILRLISRICTRNKDPA